MYKQAANFFAIIFLMLFQSAAMAIDADEMEQERVFQEVIRDRITGPATISIADQATIDLPAGYLFIPKAQTEKLMAAWGAQAENLRYVQGCILPDQFDIGWMIPITFRNDGYISDTDAKNSNMENILKDIKKAAKGVNKERVSQGYSSLDIIGWKKKPSYQAETHRFEFAVAIKSQDNTENSILNTVGTLGREGWLGTTMIVPAEDYEATYPHLGKILNTIKFNEGKRYQDYVESTDKKASYTLTALIAGTMAAKKFGLFAILGALLIKFGKLLALVPVLIAARFRKMFSRKKRETENKIPSPQPSPDTGEGV
ncbi:DUF2167 domain-containing protein [Legionella dresdenensis]|uniref:DUF2167 domain-containing protein n=1 Tax=Legionella dresdenensis TaxID=450200 RepID=A0ABV8CI39_9GAMM